MGALGIVLQPGLKSLEGPHCSTGQGDAYHEDVGHRDGSIKWHLDHQEEGNRQLFGENKTRPEGHQQIGKHHAIIVL